MRNIKYYWIGGDIHGDWRPVRNFIKNKLNTPIKESAIILLGDVGANYYLNKRDQEFKNNINKFGIRIYCLRGNHEMRVQDAAAYRNFNYFFDDEIGGMVSVEEGYPNIYYLHDGGGAYEINGSKVLVVPGAFSPDKYYRLQAGWSWFSNEQLNEDEKHRIKWLLDNSHYDYILAHTCPYSWEKYINDLFMSSISQDKIDKSMEKFLDEVIEKNSNYKHFYFGHFHDDRDIPEVNATMLFNTFIPFGQSLKT